MDNSEQIGGNAFPISVKGVVVRNGLVLLLKNDRVEWELPGGKLELGEDPERCVAREIAEEVGWQVETGPIVDAWVYHIFEGRDVFIVTYGCHLDANAAPPVHSAEHSEVGLFAEDEVAGLNMPAGYKKAIATWFERLREDADGGSDVADITHGEANCGTCSLAAVGPTAWQGGVLWPWAWPAAWRMLGPGRFTASAWKEGPMLTCPRCGGGAEYLADDTDEVFSLLRCEFCGEDLDDADQVLRHAVDRMTQTPLVSSEQLLRPREAELA